jgi:hypothetical protein
MIFFYWFKEAELINEKYKFKKRAKDLHIIYGYLQIGDIYTNNFPTWLKYHPHSKYETIDNNCIFVASEKLSLDNDYNGYDVFKFNTDLILTKNGETKSKWDLPDFFKDVTITHHNKSSFKENYFQSANIGQEFIIDCNDNVINYDNIINWVKNIIKKGATSHNKR